MPFAADDDDEKRFSSQKEFLRSLFHERLCSPGGKRGFSSSPLHVSLALSWILMNKKL